MRRKEGAFIAAQALITAAVLALVSLPLGSTGTEPASAPSCLVSIPGDAQMDNLWNSTFNGNVVTYSNGTRGLFSAYSCPQPVYGERSNPPPMAYCNSTNDLYAMATAAESNSSFVAAENGSRFVFRTASGLTYYDSGTCAVTLFFYRYGERTTYFYCGGANIFEKEALAGMEVTFVSTGDYNANGVWINHEWDLQNPSIRTMSADEIAAYYAHGYPCG
jgi:hypothetical protein